MAVEHRWNRRVAVEMPAVVYHPRYGSSRVCVRDASLGGAFLQCTQTVLPLNTPVTLLLPFEVADGTQLLQVSAMVVRVRKEGMGVMYLDHDRATVQTLHRWIDASRTVLDAVAMEGMFSVPAHPVGPRMDREAVALRL